MNERQMENEFCSDLNFNFYVMIRTVVAAAQRLAASRLGGDDSKLCSKSSSSNDSLSRPFFCKIKLSKNPFQLT